MPTMTHRRVALSHVPEFSDLCELLTLVSYRRDWPTDEEMADPPAGVWDLLELQDEFGVPKLPELPAYSIALRHAITQLSQEEAHSDFREALLEAHVAIEEAVGTHRLRLLEALLKPCYLVGSLPTVMGQPDFADASYERLEALVTRYLLWDPTVQHSSLLELSLSYVSCGLMFAVPAFRPTSDLAATLEVQFLLLKDAAEEETFTRG